MKRAAIVIVLFFGLQFANGQSCDLIVFADGDSIACHIDTVTETHIHFEMKVNYSWVSTSLQLSKILDYQKDVFELKKIVLKPGSSHILSTELPVRKTLEDVQRNAITLETNFGFNINIGYERMFPLIDHAGFTLKGGYSNGVGFQYGKHAVFGEIEFILGGPMHYFAGGYMIYQYFDEEFFDLTPVMLLDYRLQAKNGFRFMVRVEWLLLEDFVFLPAIGVGYGF